jgi:D-3-phosphoglycerate dehydrogenase
VYKVLTFNAISVKGLDQFNRDTYEVASDIGSPDAIILRSHKLAMEEISDSVRAIARAGAGYNNIPVSECTERGIPVFNTPGANANAVKELVATALLLGSRGIIDGIGYVKSLSADMDPAELSKLLEKEKKRFKGNELYGKTLGVVGLGAIGSMVANMGLTLGMNVIGYDPALSVEAAWRLPSDVKRMDNLTALFSRADFVTLHLPVLDSTRNLVSHDLLGYCKQGARLLNFAREEIVDTGAVVESLEEGKLGQYITDFPTPALLNRDDVLLMPHIGASTEEAEENCAVMAANQIKDFLENGNIKNSVNFPALNLERNEGYRVSVTNRNVPKLLGNMLSIFADHNINVLDMLNKSRDDVAYNLIDLETEPSDQVISELQAVEGVVNVRVI